MTRANPDRIRALSDRELGARLGRRARRARVSLSEPVIRQLVAYLRLLARWNEKINLTSLSISDPTDDAFDRLVLEPLVAAASLPDAYCDVIDIGSGGGTPAIPMKILMPGISLTMVESKTRKAAFLREAVRHLELEDAAVETARLEELLSRPTLHEAHDVAMLRAVRPEVRLLRTTEAFLREKGQIFLFKSTSSQFRIPPQLPTLAVDRVVPLLDSIGSQLAILRRVGLP